MSPTNFPTRARQQSAYGFRGRGHKLGIGKQPRKQAALLEGNYPIEGNERPLWAPLVLPAVPE
jgi:hypothetical protein